MALDLYLAFIAATTVLILIPGPAVTLIVATSLTHGARSALVTVAGSSSAIALQLAVTALGMNSVMLLLAEWFDWLRWLGVAYLLYLGLQLWRASPVALGDPAVSAISRQRLFWRGFIVNATNPKTLFFYAAFFPQFIDPQGPLTEQLIILCVTFLVIATCLDGGYALLAGRLRERLRSSRGALWRNRVSGSLMMAAAAGLALARRGS